MKPSAHLIERYFSRYPAEAARVLETFREAEIVRLLGETGAGNRAHVLAAMTPSIAARIVVTLPEAVLKDAFEHMTPSSAAHLLDHLEPDDREAILTRLPKHLVTEFRTYLEYPPDAVGRVMDPRVIALPEDVTVGEAVERVRQHATKQDHDVYIIDREQHLVGSLSLRDLLLLPVRERLGEAANRSVPSIHPLESRESLIDLFNTSQRLTIPVTDLDHQLLGVVRNQEIFRAGQEELTADMQTMVGASKDERALSPVWFSVRKRLPWMQINLLTAFLAASVVGLFESIIAQFTALAVLLPVVAGQSGNSGAQSLAVVMRGLALRDIRPSQWMRISGKELSVSFLNGVAVAATTCAGVYFWSRSGGLTLIIGISMVIAMCMAGLSGALIPIGLRAINQDPAQSSSIILTTVTDVVGFFSFLGLAVLFADLLG